jgi:cytochrome c oxidase subunit 3
MSSVSTQIGAHGGGQVRRNTRFGNGLLAVLFFLCTEVALFGSLIFAYLYLRHYQPHWPPPGVEKPALILGAANAVILLSSSVWCHFAEQAIARGERGRMLFWLALTIIFGSTFVGIQAIEYHRLNTAINKDIFGATFFTLTGLHGAHVTIGVLAWLTIFILGLRGRWTKEHHFPLNGVSLYWHFVDGVWVILFTIFYIF